MWVTCRKCGSLPCSRHKIPTGARFVRAVNHENVEIEIQKEILRMDLVRKQGVYHVRKPDGTIEERNYDAIERMVML